MLGVLVATWAVLGIAALALTLAGVRIGESAPALRRAAIAVVGLWAVAAVTLALATGAPVWLAAAVPAALLATSLAVTAPRALIGAIAGAALAGYWLPGAHLADGVRPEPGNDVAAQAVAISLLVIVAVAALLAASVIVGSVDSRPDGSSSRRWPASVGAGALALVAGAVAAVATGLAPGDLPDDATPAQVLTGATLPSLPDAGGLIAPGPLHWSPIGVAVLVAVAVSATVLAGGAARAGAGLIRVTTALVLVGVGGAAAGWSLLGPLASFAVVLFPAFVLRLALLLLVAPPLLGAGFALLRREAGGEPHRSSASIPSWGRSPILAALLVLLAGYLVLFTPVLTGIVATGFGRFAAPLVMLALGASLSLSLLRWPGRGARLAAVALVLAGLVAAAFSLAVSPTVVSAGWFGSMGWPEEVPADVLQRAAVVPLVWSGSVAVVILAALTMWPRARLAATAREGSTRRPATDASPPDPDLERYHAELRGQAPPQPRRRP